MRLYPVGARGQHPFSATAQQRRSLGAADAKPSQEQRLSSLLSSLSSCQILTILFGGTAKWGDLSATSAFSSLPLVWYQKAVQGEEEVTGGPSVSSESHRISAWKGPQRSSSPTFLHKKIDDLSTAANQNKCQWCCMVSGVTTPPLLAPAVRMRQRVSYNPAKCGFH